MNVTPDKKACSYCGQTDCQNEMCNSDSVHWELEHRNVTGSDNSEVDPLVECETSDQQWAENTY